MCYGTWVDLGYDSGCDTVVEKCEDYLTRTQCLSNNCYWYAKYPWENVSCHGQQQDIIMDYLPLIIVGIGGIVIAAAVLTGRKKDKN